jgi:hypothetical protein
MRRPSERAAATDSVTLDELVRESRPARKKRCRGGALTLKSLVALFVVFLLAVSDVFTDNVVAGFRGAVRGRTPTSFGVVVQGVFVVLFFVLASRLIDEGIV